MLLIRKYDFKPLDFYMLLKYQPLFEVEIDKKYFIPLYQEQYMYKIIPKWEQ